MARDNLREAWLALSMIRETVETLGPIGCMRPSEHLERPTLTCEAEEIVKGICVIVSRFDRSILKLTKQEKGSPDA